MVKRVREATRSPDLSGYKCTSKIKYVVCLRLFTAWFSVPSFGPCKDKTLTSKCVNTSFSQPRPPLKLFQSLSFLEVYHKYPRWQKAFRVQGESRIAGDLIFSPIIWCPKATFRLLLCHSSVGWGLFCMDLFLKKKVLTILQ